MEYGLINTHLFVKKWGWGKLKTNDQERNMNIPIMFQWKFNIIRFLLLFIILGVQIFGQSENPCEDVRYLEIKKKTLEQMSEREYEYFSQKEKECAEYSKNKSDYSIKENNRDFNYKTSIGGIYVNEKLWAINTYARLANSWGYGFIFAYKESSGGNPGGNHMPYISYEFPTGSKFISPSLVFGINYSYFDWTNYFSGSGFATGTVNNISPYFGLGINLNITDKIGIGLVGAMVESFSFTMYSDGTSEIYGEEYKLLPALTINIYDLFSR